MRNASLALAAALAAGLSVPTMVQAQATRAEELPNNNPSATWAYPNRNYFRTYVERRTVPSVTYEGNLAVGAQVPGSVVVYGIEGDPFYQNYRYARLNDRYVVIDQAGRVVDIVD